MVRPEVSRRLEDAVAVIHRYAVAAIVLRGLGGHQLVERKVEFPGLLPVSVSRSAAQDLSTGPLVHALKVKPSVE